MKEFNEESYNATISMWSDKSLYGVYSHTKACAPIGEKWSGIREKCLTALENEIQRREGVTTQCVM